MFISGRLIKKENMETKNAKIIYRIDGIFLILQLALLLLFLILIEVVEF